MTYNEAIDFLFSSLPVYQHQGPGAYKPGLDTTLALSAAFGNPHSRLRAIHIAGTNGKGSTAHTLAAMLASAGNKVGLYTSPHLIDFRERIRVNGEMIPHERVVSFTQRYLDMNLSITPTFFELTTVMAFEHFVNEGVDIAVIETGLGGRLDSTNILTPELSVITNISFDHTALLGHTLAAIATEKAGIIKPGVPVVIGEAPDAEVHEVFQHRAHECGSPIVFADEQEWWHSVTPDHRFVTDRWGSFVQELKGDCQLRNAATILAAASVLEIPAEAVREGFERVVELTGLKGRWTVVSERPLTVYDTGHNAGGWQLLIPQINHSTSGVKRLVLGFVGDKDLKPIVSQLSGIDRLQLYLTSPSVERGLPSAELARAMEQYPHTTYGTVAEAVTAARRDAAADDLIFIGGSNFTVADFLNM